MSILRRTYGFTLPSLMLSCCLVTIGVYCAYALCAQVITHVYTIHTHADHMMQLYTALDVLGHDIAESTRVDGSSAHTLTMWLPDKKVIWLCDKRLCKRKVIGHRGQGATRRQTQHTQVLAQHIQHMDFQVANLRSSCSSSGVRCTPIAVRMQGAYGKPMEKTYYQFKGMHV